MHFVRDELRANFLNLGQVAYCTLHTAHKREAARVFACHAADGEVIGHVIGQQLQDIADGQRYLPETTGTKLIWFIYYGEGGGTDQLDVLTLPVIGWKVCGGEIAPLTVEGVIDGNWDGGNTAYCLEVATGVWVFPGECTCESLDQAKQTALARFRNADELADRVAQEAPQP
jgi:hypothetical protein